MDLEVVYRADARAVRAAMDELRRGGLHPMALGAELLPGPVPIAVPLPEAHVGREILDGWHAPSAVVDLRVRQCRRQLTAAMGITIAAAFALRLACGSWLAVPCYAIALVWLVAQVVLSDVQEILEL